jgi:NAD(P)-dependent dehydrogenase (short-subunit alcohol dehydrogenase family)
MFIYDISTNLQTLEKSLESATGKLYPLKCDISKESEVAEAFKWIKTNLGGVDILINNAGVASYNTLTGIYSYIYTCASPILSGSECILKGAMNFIFASCLSNSITLALPGRTYLHLGMV